MSDAELAELRQQVAALNDELQERMATDAARIAALEARIAELTRGLGEARQLEREANHEAARLISDLASAAANRKKLEADLARMTQASKYNCDVADQAIPDMFAARAERDEAVGLLRDDAWPLIAGPGVDPTKLLTVIGTRGTPMRRIAAYLARVAAAPEKETTQPGPDQPDRTPET